MVVHIRLLKLLGKLVTGCLTSGLNAEHIQDLVDMVAERPRGIHTLVGQQLKQIGALYIQNMLLLGDVAVHGSIPDHFLVDLADEDTPNTFNSRDHDI